MTVCRMFTFADTNPGQNAAGDLKTYFRFDEYEVTGSKYAPEGEVYVLQFLFFYTSFIQLGLMYIHNGV